MCAFFFGVMLILLFGPGPPARVPVPLAGHGAPAHPLTPVQPSFNASAEGITGDDIQDLRSRVLLFPLKDRTLGDTKDSFHDARSGHVHEAIDILAPRNTPVVAVENGEIAKLWTSKYGGITIYQFNDDEKYCYYYAHLEAYAPDLSEGDHVERGEVIGFVGTSGNAPPNTPHLHFAIYKLTDEKHWWEGIAVNPYLVFRP
jgi:murein DD-endopeptidase MepM/ murein hydrolase activator NlpD